MVEEKYIKNKKYTAILVLEKTDILQKNLVFFWCRYAQVDFPFPDNMNEMFCELSPLFGSCEVIKHL